MRAFLLIVIGLNLFLLSHGQTNVSGNITDNTTWTKANSPYVLVGDINLNSGVALTLEAGVIVRSTGPFQISLKNNTSSLVAIGSQTDSIKFEVPEQERGFISFSGAKTSLSFFKYLKVVGLGEVNYRNEFIRVADTKSSEGLSISNSFFFNTAFNLRENGNKIKAEDSKFLNTYLWTFKGDTGYDLKRDLFVYSNISTKSNEVSIGSPLSESLIEESEFINSPIYAAHTKLTIQNSRFFADSNSLRANPSSGTQLFINVNQLIMSDCYLDGFNEFYGISLTDFSRVNAESSITNNVFYRIELPLQAYLVGKTIFHNNDIIEASKTINFIYTLSGSEVDARNNFFDGITDLISLEDRIHHLPDGSAGGPVERTGGIVDFSSPLASPINTNIVITPSFSFSRNRVNDTFIDEVSLMMNQEGIQLHRSYEVYLLDDQHDHQLILKGVFDANEEINLPFEESEEYYLRAIDLNGEVSMFTKPFNDRPLLFNENPLPRTLEAGSTLRTIYKVFDADHDYVELIPRVDYFGQSFVEPESLNLNQTGASGDTLIYELEIVLSDDDFGYLSIAINYSDGLYIGGLQAVSSDVLSKPVIQSVSPVSGFYEGFNFDMNEPELFKVIQSTGQENDPNRIKITEVLNGTLRYKGEVVTSMDFIYSYAGSNELFWEAPLGTGIVDAFKVKLYNTKSESEEEATIQFDLLANTAPEVTLIDTLSASEDELRYVFYDFQDSFLDHVESNDQEDHLVYFIITEVVNGRLLSGNDENATDLLLPIELSATKNRVLYWMPPSDENGKIAAFKIKATDGSKDSEQEYAVFFDVTSINDVPHFDFIPDPQQLHSNGTPSTLNITGISDGPNEDEPLYISASSSNQAVIPQDNINIEYDIEAGMAQLSYTPIDGAVGTSIITVRLNDGETHFEQEVQFTFSPYDAPPVISAPDRVVAYTDYPFNLEYTLTDDQEYFSALGQADSDWLKIDNRSRIRKITSTKNYSGNSRNGLLTEALIPSAYSMIMDKHQNIWLSNYRRINMITPEGVVYTVAGNGEYGNIDGKGKEARFSVVTHMAYDETEDVVYFIDDFKIIKKIDSEFNVSTVFKSNEPLDVHGNFGPLDIDSSGNLFFANAYFYGNYSNILKLNKQGELSLFAGAANPSNGTVDGQKENISIFDVNALKIVDDNIYFTGSGLFRKIDQTGSVSQIALPDGYSNDGYDSYLEIFDKSHLLAFQKNVEKIVKVNLNDFSIEYITGSENPKIYEDGMIASDIRFGSFSGIHFSSMIQVPDKGVLVSLNEGNNSFYALIRNEVDSIQGIAKLKDIGEHTVTITTKDFQGNTSAKTIIVEVRENNKIQTSNLNQTLTFDEDSPLVDLDDIVLSGLQNNEEALVRIKLMPNKAGELTTGSGNGETFDFENGIWRITGSQAAVNSALASIALIPTSDWDTDFEAEVVVVNAAGGVPNKGNINFKVTPIADIPRLVTGLTDKAYAEIPYQYEFKAEDPDSYFFSFKIGSYPDWLTYSEESWIETFAGNWDYRGSTVNGDLDLARFESPRKISKDYVGNLYVIQNYYVRKITPEGLVSTYFSHSGGYLDGDIGEARFDYIAGIVFDQSGNAYIADAGNRRIRKIDINGVVTTIAGSGQYGNEDGPALEATFSDLRGIDISPDGSIYILDGQFVKILDMDGQITKIAGNGEFGIDEGTALEVPFAGLRDIKIDHEGNLIIADSKTIRKLDLSTNQIELIIGKEQCCSIPVNGTTSSSEVSFNDLNAIAIDENGLIHMVANRWYMKIDPVKGVTQGIGASNASNGFQEGPTEEADFSNNAGIVLVGQNVFLSDENRHIIRRIYNTNGEIEGTPSINDLGENTLEYSIIDNLQQEYIYRAIINVEDNDMPIINGTDNTFVGIENDESISLSGISLSKVEQDSIMLSLELSNPKAGAFDFNQEEGSSYDPEKGIWTIKSKQTEINEVLDGLLFHPTPEFNGRISVKVKAQRLEGMFVREERFAIEIERSNELPELDDFESIEAMVDLPLELDIPITDADFDPTDLKIEGLPEWLQLKIEAVFEVGTEANMQPTYTYSEVGEGAVGDVKLYSFGKKGLAVDSDGAIYFTNYNKVQRLKDGNVETLAQKEGTGYFAYLNQVVVVDNEVYVADETAIYRLEDAGFQLVAGGGQQLDQDGQSTEAGFLVIHDFIADGNGGFYVADEFKIRHIDDKGFVSTIAGTGNAGNITEGGNALELPLYDMTHLQLDDHGDLLFGLKAQRKLCKYKDGVIEILFPSGSYSFTPTQYNVDKLGNAFLFSSNSIYLYDTLVGGKEYVNARNMSTYQISDGKENEFQWASVSSIIRTSSNSFYLLDRSAGDIRWLKYRFDYKLVGTPPEGSEGTTQLTFKLNDGYGEEVEVQIPLNVLPSDRPKVTGLPQTIEYIEDDESVNIDPILIDEENESEVFEVNVTQTPDAGKLNSANYDLSQYAEGSNYAVKMPLSQMNDLLGSLTFKPALNWDRNSVLIFEIKREEGIQAFQDTVFLNVTPVNDAPLITDIGLQKAYVGDSISFFATFNDLEDGRHLGLSVDNLPSWLNYKNTQARSQVVAGRLEGWGGLQLSSPLESKLSAPEYLQFDNDGNLLFTDKNLHSIFKIDFEKNTVTLFAGSLREGNQLGDRLKAEFNSPTGMAVASDGTVYVNDAGNNQVKAILPTGEVQLIAGSGNSGNLEGSLLNTTFSNLREIFLDEQQSMIFVNSGGTIRTLYLNSNYASTQSFSLWTQSGRFFRGKDGHLWMGSRTQIFEFNKNGDLIQSFGSGSEGSKDGPGDVAEIGFVSSMVQNEKGEILFIDQIGNTLRKIDLQGTISTIAGNRIGSYRPGIDEQIQFAPYGNIVVREEEVFFAQSSLLIKLILDEHLFYGTPTVSDVGNHTVDFSVMDSENLASNGQIDIQVSPNDRLEVQGLDTVIFVKEKQGVFSFSDMEVISAINDEVELTIHNKNGSQISLGTSTNDLIEYDEDSKNWYLEGSVEYINGVLANLKVFSDDFEEEVLTFSFKRAGGILEAKGSASIFVEPENDSPIYIGSTSYEVVAGESLEITFDAIDPDNDALANHLSDLPNFAISDSIYLLQKYISPIYSSSLPDTTALRLSIYPTGLVKNAQGEVFFVNSSKNQVMKIGADGSYQVYAGTGSSGLKNGDRESAEFNAPYDLIFDSDGDLLVSEIRNAAIRKISPDGQVSTLIGQGEITDLSGFIGQDGYADTAKPFWIYGLDKDNEGNIYTSEYFTVGKLNSSGYLEHVAGQLILNLRGDQDGDKYVSRLGEIEAITSLGVDSLLIWDKTYAKLKLYDKGITSTLFGNGKGFVDGTFNEAKIGGVESSMQLRDGRIIFGDADYHAVRILDLKNDSIYTILGIGYPGIEDYGIASEVAYNNAKDFLELENGDILIASFGRIDRLTKTAPKAVFNPELSDIGEHKFTLRISDGKDGIIEEEITINVLAPNTQPEVLEIPDIEETYSEDGSIEISLFDYFSDFENTDSELTYELISNTDNSVVTSSPISSVDGLLKLVVVNAGTTTLTVGATDSEGASVSTSFEVVIAKAEAAIEFGTLSFINSGEAKEITVTTVPSELNYTITYAGETTAPSLVGKYAIVVTIDERNYAKEVTAELEIVNVAPEGMALSNDQIIENSGSAVIGNLSVTDQNPTDEHTFSLVEGEKDNALFSISENVLSSNSDFNYEEASSYTVSVKVEDNYGGSLVKELTISVVDINESPTIDAYDEIQIVKNLGSLSINLTGLSAGEEANQTISLSTTNSAFIKSSTVTLNADGASATLVFETSADQEGEASIQVTVKDNGGTSNGGVDAKTIEIPIEIIAPNISVIDGSNCGSGEVTMTASGANEYKWYSAPLDGSLLFEGSDFIKDVESTTEFFVAGVFNGVESKLRVPVKAVIFDELQAPQVTNNNNVLSVTSVSGISYQWFNNEESIDGATSNSFTPTETGNYSVRISNENGCFATSAVVEVVIAGIEDEYFELGVNIYPVPTSDYVYLEFSETLKKGAVLRLIDVSGKELVIYTSQAPTNKLTLDVSKVVMGMHTLIIVDGNRVARKKILIQR